MHRKQRLVEAFLMIANERPLQGNCGDKSEERKNRSYSKGQERIDREQDASNCR